MNGKIVSKFKDQPGTKIAWWAMGLGLSTLFIFPMLGIFGAVIRPVIDKAISETMGAAIGFTIAGAALILSVAAIFVGARALRKGERSWAVWFGFVPAIFVGAFWIFMVVGEFVFPH